MSRYAWLIATDHLHESDPAMFTDNDAGTAGPLGATDEQVAALKAGHGTAFRLKDDDGELYYSGRFLGDSMGGEAFAPLEDFGMPNAGCTMIEYWRPGAGGGWEVL